MADPTDFCTISDAKAFITPSLSATTASDYLLAMVITEASQGIASYISRPLVASTYTEFRNGNNRSSLRTKNWPILAVQSLAVNGQSVTAAPDTVSAGYVADDKYIYLRSGVSLGYYRNDGWAGTYGGSGGSYNGPVFLPGFKNTVISYTAGYLTPGQIAIANMLGWQPSFHYLQGNQISSGGFLFSTVQPGMSDVTMPVFNTTLGASTPDNNVIWMCQGAVTVPPGGAALLPYPITLATLQQVALLFVNRTRVGDTGTGEAQQRVSYMMQPMHATTKALLEPFKAVVPVGDFS